MKNRLTCLATYGPVRPSSAQFGMSILQKPFRHRAVEPTRAVASVGVSGASDEVCDGSNSLEYLGNMTSDELLGRDYMQAHKQRINSGSWSVHMFFCLGRQWSRVVKQLTLRDRSMRPYIVLLYTTKPGQQFLIF